MWQLCLLTNRDEMSNFYRGSSIDASYQVSVHLVVVSEEKIFRNRSIRNKNGLWRPSLLANRDEMSNLYRRSSIHVFYQISVHLGKRFQRRRCFRNQPIRNKNGLWRPCLLTDRDEISNHLARQFQRRRFLKIGESETRIACGGHVCQWIGMK